MALPVEYADEESIDLDDENDENDNDPRVVGDDAPSKDEDRDAVVVGGGDRDRGKGGAGERGGGGFWSRMIGLKIERNDVVVVDDGVGREGGEEAAVAAGEGDGRHFEFRWPYLSMSSSDRRRSPTTPEAAPPSPPTTGLLRRASEAYAKSTERLEAFLDVASAARDRSSATERWESLLDGAKAAVRERGGGAVAAGVAPYADALLPVGWREAATSLGAAPPLVVASLSTTLLLLPSLVLLRRRRRRNRLRKLHSSIRTDAAVFDDDCGDDDDDFERSISGDRIHSLFARSIEVDSDEEEEADMTDSGIFGSPSFRRKKKTKKSRKRAPRKIQGPSVTRLNYITSAPPPPAPNTVFSNKAYKSIHRKLVLDVRDLTLARCAPTAELRVKDGKILDSTKIRHEEFVHPGKILGVDGVLNVSARRPVESGTLDLMLLDVERRKREALPGAKDHRKGGRVTLENWHEEGHDHYVGNKGARRRSSSELSPEANNDNRPGERLDKIVKDPTDVDDSTGGVSYQTPTVRTRADCLSVGLPPSEAIDVDNPRGILDDPALLGLEAMNEEYTFRTARAAAEFQSVSLALRIVGREIRNMFIALEIAHAGSEAYGGERRELVLGSRATTEDAPKASEGGTAGDDKKDGEGGGGGEDAERKKQKREHEHIHKKSHKRPIPPVIGVSLDDCYRCLGSLPFIKRELDRMFEYHYRSTDDGATAKEKNHVDDLITNAADASPPAADAAKKDGKDGGKGGDGDGDGAGDSAAARAALYKNKRLILGHIDFFRLFVPAVPDDAVPYASPTADDDPRVPDGIASHRDRILRIAKLRKRVARSALHVRSYVTARHAINLGWTVPPPPPGMVFPGDRRPSAAPSEAEKKVSKAHPPADLVKRLAFDDDFENVLHDMPAKNEYYEASIGRDVLVAVHDEEYLRPATDGGGPPAYASSSSSHSAPSATSSPTTNGATMTQSQYQGYGLVAVHVFKLPPREEAEEGGIHAGHPLRPTIDPVEALPSLRRVIEDHPERDFFVYAKFPEDWRIGIVGLWVRTLPKGVDRKFDRVMENVRTGDAALRDRKMNVHLQFGPGPNLSTLAWATLKAMGAALSLMGKRRSQFSSGGGEGANGRTTFPGVTISRYAKTRHFGGPSLWSNPSLPKNYIALTAHIDKNNLRGLSQRVLYFCLGNGLRSGAVIDFSFVLEGEAVDELPERAMATARMVHVDHVSVSLPVSWSADREKELDIVFRDGLAVSAASIRAVPGLEGEDGDGVEPAASSSGRESFFSTLTSRFSMGGGVREGAEGGVEVRASPSGIDGEGEEEAEAGQRGGSLRRDRVDETSRAEEKKEPRDEEKVGEEDEAEDADPHKAEIDALGDILDGITVPFRKEAIERERSETGGAGGDWSVAAPAARNRGVGAAAPSSPSAADDAGKVAASLKLFLPNEMVDVAVLHGLTRYDLRRYFVASHFDLKLAAVRIVESAAWRGVTFPVDIRTCRVELQSGQFFQQGYDRDGNPVFYFKNMCLGPWRKDVDAVIFAVAHRLESSLKRLVEENPEVRCTVIVLMGKPIDELVVEVEEEDSGGDNAAAEGEGAASGGATAGEEGGDGGTKKKKKKITKRVKQRDPLFVGANPHIEADEEYNIHTNFALVKRLNQVLSRHYPERLAKVLIVPSGGWVMTVGTFGLRHYVPAQRTRDKLITLNSAGDLKKYVDEDELVTFAGGKSLVSPDAFSCW